MSVQRPLFAPPPPPSQRPLADLWDGQTVKKGDPERVAAVITNFTTKKPSAATLADLANLTGATVKTQVPARLFKILEQRLAALGTPFTKTPKWVGRTLITDLWAEVFLKRTGNRYDWDLHLTCGGPAWKSTDHDAAMTLVGGAAPMVLAPGVAFEDGVPPEMERWHETAPERLPVRAEEARAQLRLGQLVRRSGARWEPWKSTLDDERPEGVVVEETEDGWVLDTSQRAMVVAVLRAAMFAYIHEATGNGDDPRMIGFVRKLVVYVSGVLGQNAAEVPQNVIAMRWRPGGHKALPGQEEPQDDIDCEKFIQFTARLGNGRGR